MKQNLPVALQKPLMVAILTAAFSTSSWAISTQQVLQNIRSHLPEQQLSQGFSQTEQALQTNKNAYFPEAPSLIASHENDALTGNESIQNWNLGVETTLWRTEQKQGIKDLFNANHQQQLALQGILNLKASGLLRKILGAVNQAQIELSTAQQQLQQTQQVSKMINTRVQIGASPKLDGLLAQKSVIEAKQALIQAQSNLDTALNSYFQWTGTHALPNYHETQTASSAPNWWLNHPEVRQLQAKIATLQAKNRQIKGEQKSPIKLFAGLNQEARKNTPTNASITLQITLPLGKNSLGKISLAEQEQTLLTEQVALNNLTKRLKIQKIQAENNLTLAQQQAALAKEQQTLAKQTLQMAKQSYQAGETGIQNLLVSQQQMLSAEKRYQLSQIQIQQAIAQFNQILGETL